MILGTTYLFAAGSLDDGISVFTVDANGFLSNGVTITDADDPAYALDGVSSLATVEADGTTYLFAAGTAENGVSVFAITNEGALNYISTINDADDPNYELEGVSSLATAIINNVPYLFAAGSIDDGVSIFAVKNDGSLTNVDNIETPVDATNALAVSEGLESTLLAVAGDIQVNLFELSTDLFNEDGFTEDGDAVIIDPNIASIRYGARCGQWRGWRL